MALLLQASWHWGCAVVRAQGGCGPGAKGQEGWERRRGDLGLPTSAQAGPSPPGPGQAPAQAATPREGPAAREAPGLPSGHSQAEPRPFSVRPQLLGRFRALYPLPVTAVTNHHQLGVLKPHIFFLTVLTLLGVNPDVGRPGPSRSSRGEPFPPLPASRGCISDSWPLPLSSQPAVQPLPALTPTLLPPSYGDPVRTLGLPGNPGSSSFQGR